MDKDVNIVLGGTSGLGREIAYRLREDNQEVWVLGSSYDDTEDGDGLQIDLASEKSVDDAVKALNTKLGNRILNSLWWVSGYGYNGDFADQEDPRRMAMVNFSGPLPVVQWAWQELLVQDRRGTIAIVSSTTGEKARDDEAVYAGTKFAEVGFGRSLGMEAKRLQSLAQVALFMPGGMQTDFWKGQEPVEYETYNDPEKVADDMIIVVRNQTLPFTEKTYPRGSLV